MSNPTEPNASKRRHGLVALSLAGLVAGMVGLAFASVPLYRMFCQVTGYGGQFNADGTYPGFLPPMLVEALAVILSLVGSRVLPHRLT